MSECKRNNDGWEQQPVKQLSELLEAERWRVLKQPAQRSVSNPGRGSATALITTHEVFEEVRQLRAQAAREQAFADHPEALVLSRARVSGPALRDRAEDAHRLRARHLETAIVQTVERDIGRKRMLVELELAREL